MLWTAIDRRSLLVGGGAALAALALGPERLRAGETGISDDPLFAAARREADGSHSIVVTGLDGIDRQVIPLPGRGHDVAICPLSGRCLAFARRPGTFAVSFHVKGERPPVVFEAVPGRHFYGHGAFSPDGRLAYATENDYVANRGVIGVYDLSGERPERVGEFWSGGIGPHDILPLPDGRSLVVANGGIETHPDKGREKLNIETMQPNVTVIDRESGTVRGVADLPSGLHKLSLRHMAVTDGGKVWIGGQYEGSIEETPPLMASLDTVDGRLLLHDVPDDLRGRLANYVGSVTMSRDGEVVAASCPRAGRVLYFSAANGTFLSSQQRADACGLAPLDRAGFLISDGQGALSESGDRAGAPMLLASSAGISWDNHMVAVDPA